MAIARRKADAVTKPAKKQAVRKSPPAAKSPHVVKVSKAKVKSANVFATGLVAVLKKKAGKEGAARISLLSDGTMLSAVTEWIPSMFPNIDAIIGGGWAVGRCSEVLGPEGAGKSALTQQAIVGVQSIGGIAMVFDYEAALDPEKIEQQGIDPERLIYLTPEHVEAGWDLLWAAVEEAGNHPPDAPLLIVWDSVAAAPAKAEMAKSAGEKTMAEKARLMSLGCRKLILACARVRVHVMFVNQERESLNQTPGFYKEPETPGGKGVRYAASQRVRCTRVKTIKESRAGNPQAVGYVIRALTKKCRLAPPHQRTEFILDFIEGPSPELTQRHLLEGAKIINIRPKSKDGKLPQGYVIPGLSRRVPKRKWLEMLREDEELRERVNELHAELVVASDWSKVARTDADEEADAENEDGQ